MQSIRNSILKQVRVRCSRDTFEHNEDRNVLVRFVRLMCTSKLCTSKRTCTDDQTMERVIGLVKKFNIINGSKVTETADFQKDLCMDSLDRVELVMAFEEEFSMEIPEEDADKLTCCADVAKYITTQVEDKTAKS